MGPLELIAALDAVITLATKLTPVAQQLLNSGAATPEEQAALQALVTGIRDGSAFNGPEWQVDGPPPLPPA